MRGLGLTYLAHVALLALHESLLAVLGRVAARILERRHPLALKHGALRLLHPVRVAAVPRRWVPPRLPFESPVHGEFAARDPKRGGLPTPR